MTSAVNNYCTRESIIQAIQWTGTDTSFNEIKKWAGDKVKAVGEELYADLDPVDRVPVGNYLYMVGRYLQTDSPENFIKSYVKTIDD